MGVNVKSEMMARLCKKYLVRALFAHWIRSWVNLHRMWMHWVLSASFRVFFCRLYFKQLSEADYDLILNLKSPEFYANNGAQQREVFEVRMIKYHFWWVPERLLFRIKLRSPEGRQGWVCFLLLLTTTASSALSGVWATRRANEASVEKTLASWRNLH